ncbi:DUF4198 domain-containing protein [Thermaerobacter sp. PB12/4term]|uniref:DUF4198 domain-containing protein n=1 Tax=Thermaerobacter sp. PB12/4term TaxID=2293838 RepID=UPI000E32CF21|nr:DUF4198 domain-containing protein [Thermaerobacter sp. PB12/4term]QIA26482.1 DUF4198 domain-containing protein [Thermaerobacter sp. PB12/4term]
MEKEVGAMGRHPGPRRPAGGARSTRIWLPSRPQLLMTIAAATLVLTTAVPATAHDRWVQPYSPVVTSGQVAYFDIMLGNHSNEHRSYRLAGKPGREGLDVLVIGPDGQRTSLNDTLFDTGEADDTPPAGPKGYLCGSFVPQSEGTYIVAATADAVLQHGDEPPFRSLSLAKTVVMAASSLPATASNVEGYDRPVADDRLEIVPKVNPAALFPGEEVRLQILLKGEPLSGQKVAVIRRSTSEFKEYETDSQGMIRFPAGEPDYYLVRLEYDSPQEKQTGQYEKTTYEATFTYAVQRPAAGKVGGQRAADRVPGWAWLVAGGLLGVAGSAIGGRWRR